MTARLPEEPETRAHTDDVLSHIDHSAPPLSTPRTERLKREFDAMTLRAAASVLLRRARHRTFTLRAIAGVLVRAAERIEAEDRPR